MRPARPSNHIEKHSAIFQYELIIFPGQFSVISASSIEIRNKVGIYQVSLLNGPILVFPTPKKIPPKSKTPAKSDIFNTKSSMFSTKSEHFNSKSRYLPPSAVVAVAAPPRWPEEQSGKCSDKFTVNNCRETSTIVNSCRETSTIVNNYRETSTIVNNCQQFSRNVVMATHQDESADSAASTSRFGHAKVP